MRGYNAIKNLKNNSRYCRFGPTAISFLAHCHSVLSTHTWLMQLRT